MPRAVFYSPGLRNVRVKGKGSDERTASFRSLGLSRWLIDFSTCRSPKPGAAMRPAGHQAGICQALAVAVAQRIERLRYIHRNPVKRGLVLEPDQ
jgi:hypothetical protein